MKSNDLKAGMAINLDGKLYIVTRTEHVKPGKGPAYIQAKVKAIPSGAVTEKRLRSSESVERAVLDRREMQYLYSDASGHVFMDNETYDQMAMQDDLVGEAMPFLKSNTDITVLVYKGAPISLELPSSVELTVTQTTPVVKGATATNQPKEAELETGLKTRVPAFIEEGELVRISTESGDYLGRAKE